MLALPLLVLTTIWAAGGWPLARWAAFPVLYLYFALPAWDFLDLPLQSLTTDVSIWLVRQVGIPATTDGHVIHIPEGWFEIAVACNGLHFVVVALAIAAVHGEIDDDSLGSRLLLMGIAGVLAIATNWLTGVHRHRGRARHEHAALPGPGRSLLFRVVPVRIHADLLRLPVIAHPASEKHSQVRWDREGPGCCRAAPNGSAVTAIVLSAVALSLGPLWAQAVPRLAAPLGDEAPPQLAGWSGPTPYVGAWRPVFENADQEWLVGLSKRALRRSCRSTRRPTVTSGRARNCGDYDNSVVGPRHTRHSVTRPRRQAQATALSRSRSSPPPARTERRLSSGRCTRWTGDRTRCGCPTSLPMESVRWSGRPRRASSRLPRNAGRIASTPAARSAAWRRRRCP